MTRRARRLRDRFLGRLKAVAAAVGGYATLAIAYVLLDDSARATITDAVPDWARSVVLVLLPAAVAWAVERTRNRGPDAPDELDPTNR